MYSEIFDSIPWPEVGISVVQTMFLYWFVLLGLKLAGRHVFSEIGAQDLVILMLVAEAANQGLTHTDAGFWGSFFSVLSIILTGAIIERVPFLRRKLDGRPVTLYKDGRLDRDTMKKYEVDESALEEAAREYGLESYHQFSVIMLEGNGQLTGIIKAGLLPGRVAQHSPA